MDSKPTAAAAAPSIFLLVQNLGSDEDHFRKNFPARTVNILAIIQMVSCLISMISPIFVLFFAGAYAGIELSFAGIWCGAFFGISGFIGCLAARYPSSERSVGFMVMSVISSCFCLPLLISFTIQNTVDLNIFRVSTLIFLALVTGPENTCTSVRQKNYFYCNLALATETFAFPSLKRANVQLPSQTSYGQIYKEVAQSS